MLTTRKTKLVPDTYRGRVRLCCLVIMILFRYSGFMHKWISLYMVRTTGGNSLHFNGEMRSQVSA